MFETGFRHKPILSAILIVTVAAIINISSHFYFEKSLSSQNRLSNDIALVNSEQEVIKQLYHELGYGGFIHNFKNLLLRGDVDKYAPKIEKNIVTIRGILKELESLGQDKESQEGYRTIASTLEEYFSKYNILKQKIRESVDIRTIDKVVKVDDTTALLAIDAINRKLLNRQAELNTQLMQSESEIRVLAAFSNILLLACIVVAAYIIFRYQKQLNKKYLEAARAKEIMDSSDIGFWEIDLRSLKSTWSKVTANIHEVDADYEINPRKGVEFFKEGESRDTITKVFSDAISHGTRYDVELPFITAKGNEKWVRSVGIPVMKDGVTIKVYGTFQDITKRKNDELLLKESRARLDEVNKELLELSYLDQLTKIPNRRAFEEKLISEISSSARSREPLSLMMIDVDCFKQYNDTYGHKSGDLILYKVAQKIKDSLPREIDFVARYGGEEIVVILPRTNQDGAILVAERIINNVAGENIEHSKSVFTKVTVSVGVASTNENFSDLVSYADKALYKAKKNGRNRYESYSL